MVLFLFFNAFLLKLIYKNRKIAGGCASRYVFYEKNNEGGENLNYIGSKHSLLDFIVEGITSVVGTDTNKTFADLFAGTGAVSKRFRELGYSVISNDIQYYSFVLLKHYIENDSSVKLNEFSYLNFAIELPAALRKYSFIYNNYCAGSGSERNYFSDYNGKSVML